MPIKQNRYGAIIFKNLLPISLLTSAILLTACESKVTNSNTHQRSLFQNVDFTQEALSTLPNDFSAHWVSPTLLLLPKVTDKNLAQAQYSLVSFSSNDKSQADTIIPLQKTTEATTVNGINIRKQFPHLSNFQAYTVNTSTEQAKKLLKTKLAVVTTINNQPHKVAYLQTASIIDQLYTAKEFDANEEPNLGATILETGVNFKLWAPSASSVSVLLFNEDETPAKPISISMVENTDTGIWQATGDTKLNQSYYQYKIDVYHPESKQFETLVTTDPYSLSLSINSKYSQVVDLNSPTTQPSNWQTHSTPIVEHIEDNIFYETHIRDFSAFDPFLSNKGYRGKYKAFSEKNSAGIQHLQSLKEAGINNIHLLPTFDIGTVNEDSSQSIDINDSLSKLCQLAPNTSVCHSVDNLQQSLSDYLSSLPTNSDKQQAIISAISPLDNYNWGYDPFHYTVPEGSYAINPQGVSRIVEFREMVQSIHQLGFRVIMDVVYNHTHQAGLKPTSVLDKIVPNYYHRLDPITGKIAQSTCCDNTATEHVMMTKLMTDSLVVWARDYKIDGFRFDLMAHQPKAAMLSARKAVQQVDNDTYFYGEGWNFGEVANNQRFVQASQLELSGTEIGTFTDRLRDAVRGGAFTATGEKLREDQGLGNGLITSPNELQLSDRTAKYQLMMDQLRIGLAGNLAEFQLINSQGAKVKGKDIPYGSQPTGYALDPADSINYVSKHDNQTLWDNNQYRLSFNTSTQDRVRFHLQSLSIPILAQGIPFLHMGSELLRSKSFLRDSYDYGDWFNKVDFTKQSNNYNVGLPPADKDQANWPLIQGLLINNEQRDMVSSKDIHFSSEVFNEFIKIRMSTPLFRLNTAAQIIEQVKFYNTGETQQKGLIVMSITQNNEKNNQAVQNNPLKIKELIVFFNMSNERKIFDFKGAAQYQLHPIQKNGVDDRVKNSKVLTDSFVIPKLTTAVFIKSL